MAKRFTDTDKWKKGWFAELSPAMKLLWIYILDNCDSCGIWDINFKLAEFQIGLPIKIDEAKKIFKKQYIDVTGSKWFIIDFIEFQYKCSMKELNPLNKAHIPIISMIKKYKLSPLEGASKGLKRGMQAPQDMDMDKDKDKEGGVGETKYPYFSEKDFQEAWAGYLEMRKKIKKPITDGVQSRILKKLHTYPLFDAVVMLNQSELHNWVDVYDVKKSQKQKDTELQAIRKKETEMRKQQRNEEEALDKAWKSLPPETRNKIMIDIEMGIPLGEMGRSMLILAKRNKWLRENALNKEGRH